MLNVDEENIKALSYSNVRIIISNLNSARKYIAGDRLVFNDSVDDLQSAQLQQEHYFVRA